MSHLPHQVTDFLAMCAPFDALDTESMHMLAGKCKVVYLTQANLSSLLADMTPGLFLVHSGQFSVQDDQGPTRHLSEGDFFGYAALLDNVEYSLNVKVDSPGLVYHWPAQAFTALLKDLPTLERFFRTLGSEKQHSDAVHTSNSMWLYKPLHQAIERSPIIAQQHISIGEAAKLMAQQRVSSLLISDGDRLTGIITDRDLRNRVVAKELDTDLPVQQVMTPEPACINRHRTLFDAMVKMSEHSIHHLPVVDGDTLRPVGMVTASDLIRHQRGNILYIIDELAKAESLYDLSRTAWQIPQYFAAHAKRPGDFDIAGKVLSQASDIMTRKLLSFFQQQHGPAPVDYCWIVYGSQAREDQTMGSDQDNGLLLGRDPSDDEAEYFSALAEYVCQGLGKCGIKLCAGNIMASNPELRLSLPAAIEEARRWVAQPTSEAIMHFNIFLDARAVAGDVDLFRQMQEARAPMLKQPMFLAALARHANETSVPLSLFRKFVYAKGHPDKDVIDLKTGAIAIINNLVRIYALASGLTIAGTVQRLARLPEDSQLSRKDAANLKDIWMFLNRLRWRHQLQNHCTDNLVSVSDLSPIQKHQLKASFRALDDAQQAAVLKFSGGVG